MDRGTGEQSSREQENRATENREQSNKRTIEQGAEELDNRGTEEQMNRPTALSNNASDLVRVDSSMTVAMTATAM